MFSLGQIGTANLCYNTIARKGLIKLNIFINPLKTVLPMKDDFPK